MEEPDAVDMKSGESIEEELGVKYNDPLLVPTPVLLARREVASKHPQATVNNLQRIYEEKLIYRKYVQKGCQLPGVPKSTFLMVFSPDGSKVASTHGDHNIYVCDVKSGRCLCKLEGHPRTPWCVAFHPGSNEIIASGCLGGEVRVWDLKGGSEVWSMEKDAVIASLAFHPTDQVLVIATHNEIYFWDWFQPKPFASISTGDEKEKVKYVKFDPLGHKLITGIANTPHDRSAQGIGRSTGSNPAPLSRLELVAREIRLSHRYNQLSSRFRDLMNRYEALTSTTLNNPVQTTSRVDRGTDPIEPPPATLGQQALLNQACQFAQQVTEEHRASTRSQGTSQTETTPRPSTWGSVEAHSSRESQTSGGSGETNPRLEEDYGLSAVRTLRQIISDDSASSSSLDSSSSATSGTSGVSERNTRLSLLWTSRLQRPGQDSDSAGEVSSVHSDANPLGGFDMRPTAQREADTPPRIWENSGGALLGGSNGPQGSDDDDDPDQTALPTSGPPRPGSLWGYYSTDGVMIRSGRTRGAQDRLNVNSGLRSNRPSPSNPTAGSSSVDNFQNETRTQNRTLDTNNRRVTGRGKVWEALRGERATNALPTSGSNAANDRDEDLAIPGPSGLSGASRSAPSLPLYNASTIDPHFGVQLLSGHIENMQRICRAHLEITRHRHEIRRLQQIRTMLYDIQQQIHSLRASVDQSIEDLTGSLISMSNSPTTSSRNRSGEEEDRPPRPDRLTAPVHLATCASPRSYSTLRRWNRTSPRSVARLQRGPFGTRTRSRHSHSSWAMSPSVFRRIPRSRSSRTRHHLPGSNTPARGTNVASTEASGDRMSPVDQLNAISGGAIGPLPTPPPDQRDSEEPRHIIRVVSGDSNITQTRTMLRERFEQLQERLRARQEVLEQQERRLRGFLGNTPSSARSSTLERDADPPSPPARIRRSRPPTTSLRSRIENMLILQAANENNNNNNNSNNNSNSENSSQWFSTRRRIRQTMNARRDMLVGRTPGTCGGPMLYPVSRLRSRNSNAERVHVLIREGLRRERRDRYRQILRHMADRLNSLVNQEQEQQDQQQEEDTLPTDSANPGQPGNNGNSMDNHMENLRLLVRLALHLIDQLLNFICNQNISYEERPISRLPNPFREEEPSATGDGGGGESSRTTTSTSDLPSPVDMDISPGLHNLTTLFETVRMASEELRNDEGGGDGEGGAVGGSNETFESSRPITNVPRRVTDFLRRSRNLTRQLYSSANEASGNRSLRSNTTAPQLVIPRITLSDPSGSESQVEDDAASAAAANARISYSDRAEFSTRTISGVPLRVLGRQYAVDRRSPPEPDDPLGGGIPDDPQDGAPQHPPPDPSLPWRGPYNLGGFSRWHDPNMQRASDRAAERESDNFFSRPYYASHPASRTVNSSLATHRIQAWDFTKYRIPDISDSISNVVVGKCKIHNDASVDVSADGTLLAALVPESQAMIMVGVYSLENRSLGQLLYSYIFPPNTICISLSPVARHLVVGFCLQMPRLVAHHNPKQVVAQIYKLCDNPMFHGRGQAGHLQFLRDIEVVCEHRHTSLNCIRWLPYPGQGLIYGNNRGQLNILR